MFRGKIKFELTDDFTYISEGKVYIAKILRSYKRNKLANMIGKKLYGKKILGIESFTKDSLSKNEYIGILVEE